MSVSSVSKPSKPVDVSALAAAATPRALVTAVSTRLAAAGSHSPEAEARQLVAHAAGISLGALAIAEPLTAAQVATLAELATQRAAGVPLQYLLGSVPFGDAEISVGPGVFIPRPETELLFDAAQRWLHSQQLSRPAVIVDLCTGSGALAAALALEFPDAAVTAVELDPQAVEYAQRNFAAVATDGGAVVTLVHGDCTAPDTLAPLNGTVDLLVTNPPYVPMSAKDLVDRDTLTHDPEIAVFGGADGMGVIHRMVGVCADLVRPGGGIFLEHDDSTAAATAAALQGVGFTEVLRHRDFSGRERFVSGIRAGAAPAAADAD